VNGNAPTTACWAIHLGSMENGQIRQTTGDDPKRLVAEEGLSLPLLRQHKMGMVTVATWRCRPRNDLLQKDSKCVKEIAFADSSAKYRWLRREEGNEKRRQ
jgi:hypothetical protein